MLGPRRHGKVYGDTYHCLIAAVLDHRLYEAGIMHAFFFFFFKSQYSKYPP